MWHAVAVSNRGKISGRTYCGLPTRGGIILGHLLKEPPPWPPTSGLRRICKKCLRSKHG